MSLEDIAERFKEKDDYQKKENEEKEEKAAEDAKKAAEMRKRSIITFTERQNRSFNNDEQVTPKWSTISDLTTRYENESKPRREELALRREEIETTKNIIYQKQSQLLNVLVQNQQNQQNAILALLQKLADK